MTRTTLRSTVALSSAERASSKGRALDAATSLSAGRRGFEGAIDVLIRRSTNGGRTWDAPRKLLDLSGRVPKNPVAVRQKIGREGETTHNNPVAIVDRGSGTVHFLCCVEYRRCHHLTSKQGGKCSCLSCSLAASRPMSVRSLILFGSSIAAIFVTASGARSSLTVVFTQRGYSSTL